MIVIAGLILGAIFGFRLASRHGGKPADKAQYAIACAIAGSLIGLVLTIVVERLVA
ncbi:hypothetical protein [Palleronia caenipelagi]|uniref:hypothetical protein n=1 Tax=Palleronia caenipelagi TaxID=2489174 RepID=UPI00163D8573|nr:hypothetical protein [Palleronia caenipelagi]